MLNKFFIALLFLCFFCGCKHNEDDGYSENSITTEYSENSLTTEFKVKDKFGVESTNFVVGDEINFELTVTNEEDYVVTYLATGVAHDFLVLNGEALVWSKYNGIGSTAEITERDIEPNETIVLTAEWNGINNEGDMVPPGEYIAKPSLFFFLNNYEIKVPVPEPINIILY